MDVHAATFGMNVLIFQKRHKPQKVSVTFVIRDGSQSDGLSKAQDSPTGSWRRANGRRKDINAQDLAWLSIEKTVRESCISLDDLLRNDHH
jgi:hypothetical protein